MEDSIAGITLMYLNAPPIAVDQMVHLVRAMEMFALRINAGSMFASISQNHLLRILGVRMEKYALQTDNV
jgi:hypothetical protein